MGFAGKQEYRVKKECAAAVEQWTAEMEREYVQDGNIIRYHVGPPWESGFPGDASVAGRFFPLTAEIHIFYAEERRMATKAEELAHYRQCKERGLIGLTEEQIGSDVIDEMEAEVVAILLEHGFEPIR